MREKAKNVFVAQEKLKAKNRSFLHEQDQFFSGGKVSFRGRRLAVLVEYGEMAALAVTYRSRFHIVIQRCVQEDEKEHVVGEAVDCWLRARLLEDSVEIAYTLGRPLDLACKAVRVRAQKNIWATCGKDGILYINHQLIKVSRKVLEYVIAHKLAHLKHRIHSNKFWELVGRMAPNYMAYQNALDRW